MKKFVIASTLAAMLGAVSYSAFAQENTAPLPPAAEQQADGGGHDGQRGDHGERGKRHKRGQHGHGHMGGMGRMGAMIDANGDNVIGDSEAAALADRSFARLDRDGNGELDETEFTTVRQRGGGSWWRGNSAQTEGITEGLKAKFAALDADKNSKVSKAEYMADAQTRFAATDANKDGKVSPWEFYAQN